MMHGQKYIKPQYTFLQTIMFYTTKNFFFNGGHFMGFSVHGHYSLTDTLSSYSFFKFRE